jgi:hypothetical protein
VKLLRELASEQDRTQIVLTTHSPYLLDHFRPEEVTLLSKGADGAVTAFRLSESQRVQEQIDVFTLGGIWASSGDDILRAPNEPTDKAASCGS